MSTFSAIPSLRLLLAALTIATMPSLAAAQMIAVTPEVFGKVKALAEKARSAHPTSPTEAGYLFQAAFNGEFGDTWPAVATIVETPALSIKARTPINFLFSSFATAIRTLAPFPESAPPPMVYIDVDPKRVDAPDVQRMVLFLDGKELGAAASTLAPAEFKNGLGQITRIGAGGSAWPSEVFTAGTVKMVFITKGTPIEWEYVPGQLGYLK